MMELWLQIKGNQDRIVRDMFSSLELSYIEIKSSQTRYEHDSTDYSGWILNYPEGMREVIKKDKRKLESIKIFGKPMFNVIHNGYGTGICVSMNSLSYKPESINSFLTDSE